MSDIENRMVLPFHDDEVEMYSRCDKHPDEWFEVESYCSLCFREKRMAELDKEMGITEAMKDIFGPGYSLKNQAE